MYLEKVLFSKIEQGERLGPEQALLLATCVDLKKLTAAAAAIRDHGHADVISYSPQVFIPLPALDICNKDLHSPSRFDFESILAIARAGQQAGGHEIVFSNTTADAAGPHDRSICNKLDRNVDWAAVIERIINETGLLPHLDLGAIKHDDLLRIHALFVAQRLTLTVAQMQELEKQGRVNPHTTAIAAAGQAGIPLTVEIAIKPNETRNEYINVLLSLRGLHEQYQHIQAISIRIFNNDSDTDLPRLDWNELLWAIATTRLIFGAQMNIQFAPCWSPDILPQLINAGINDWGSIVVSGDSKTVYSYRDDALQSVTALTGKHLLTRLPIYPGYIAALDKWVAPKFQRLILSKIDATYYVRSDDWSAGLSKTIPQSIEKDTITPAYKSSISYLLDGVGGGKELTEKEIIQLFSARGRDLNLVCSAADELRTEINGDVVTYVVNRNINYTNICYFNCRFCGFSKGRVSKQLREPGYNFSTIKIQQLVQDAWHKGASEVCLQGGIHPSYTGETYLAITRAVRQVAPDIHIHAFSPLEIFHGASTTNTGINDYLTELKMAGLDSLPGTAAEILDDEVRAIICPDKINTAQWLNVVKTAHQIGLASTATIMFGHVDTPLHWARHLINIRNLQEQTDGFTEFVPLPYIHMSTPLNRIGGARLGPTFREVLLMHAVARLALYPHISNIQASWVKLGKEGIQACLNAGVNDLGGTLMHENISRSAGATYGQALTAEELQRLILACNKTPRQRTTLYGDPGLGYTHLPNQKAF